VGAAAPPSGSEQPIRTNPNVSAIANIPVKNNAFFFIEKLLAVFPAVFISTPHKACSFITAPQAV
jgi:hypothetical protein